LLFRPIASRKEPFKQEVVVHVCLASFICLSYSKYF